MMVYGWSVIDISVANVPNRSKSIVCPIKFLKCVMPKVEFISAQIDRSKEGSKWLRI